MDYTQLSREVKGALTDFKTAYDSRLNGLQSQADAIDVKIASPHHGGGNQRSLADILGEHDGLKRLLADGRGKATLTLKGADALLFDTKTTITSGVGGTVGTSTSGVLQIGRLGEITGEARQALTLRDLLTATPTTFQVIDNAVLNSPFSLFVWSLGRAAVSRRRP